ncbi:MAG: CPBP family intramembrane metalloprotease [Spirochaetes bacterium]|nr:CPBP family intramembrane metalloprotease [Spirochaetota bacterium]
MNAKSNYPKISQAIFLLILFIFLDFVISLIVAEAGISLKIKILVEPTENEPLIAAIGSIISVIIIVLFIRKKANRPFKTIFKVKNIYISSLFFMFLAIIGIDILLNEFNNILGIVLPGYSSFSKLLANILFDKNHFLSSLLFVIAVAPITEELFFRGIILHGFLKNYSKRKAIIVSALLFGLIHLNPVQLLSATVFGIIIGWYYAETGSLITCILFHSFMNSLPYIPTLLSGANIQEVTGELTNLPVHQSLWIDILGFILAVSGILLLVYKFKRAKLRKIPAGDTHF